MSLNQGVKSKALSPNIALNSSADTYLVSRTSLGLGLRTIFALGLMKRM